MSYPGQWATHRVYPGQPGKFHNTGLGSVKNPNPHGNPWVEGRLTVRRNGL